MKKVKIILCTITEEILIANFKNNYYEAIQCAKLLQSQTNQSHYIYYVEYTDTNKMVKRKQP